MRKFLTLFIAALLAVVISCKSVPDNVSDFWYLETDSVTAEIKYRERGENLIILPFEGMHPEIGSRLARFLAGNSELGTLFSLSVADPNIGAILELAEHYQETRNLYSIERIAEELDVRYIMLGNISWIGQWKWEYGKWSGQYVMVISIFDTSNSQLISGIVHAFPGIERNQLKFEDIQSKLPHIISELKKYAEKDTSSNEGLAVGRVHMTNNGIIDDDIANAIANIISIYLVQTESYAIFPFTPLAIEAGGLLAENPIPYFLSLNISPASDNYLLDAQIYDRIRSTSARQVAVQDRLYSITYSAIDETVIEKLEDLSWNVTGAEQREQMRRAQEAEHLRLAIIDAEEQQRVVEITGTAELAAQAAITAQNEANIARQAERAANRLDKSYQTAEEERKALTALKNARNAETNAINWASETERIAGLMETENGKSIGQIKHTEALDAVKTASNAVNDAKIYAESITDRKNSQAAKERKNEKRWSDGGKKLWSVGFNAGSSFATPLLMINANVTLAPISKLFFELGFDYGLLHGDSLFATKNRMRIYDVDYTSQYYYARINTFASFKNLGGGIYLGAGAGYMMSYYTYKDPQTDADEALVPNLALDLAVGFLFRLGNDRILLRLGYGFRTNFNAMNHRAMVGLTFRLGTLKFRSN